MLKQRITILISLITLVGCATAEEKKPVHHWLRNSRSGTILLTQNQQDFVKLREIPPGFEILAKDIQQTLLFRVPELKLNLETIEIDALKFKGDPDVARSQIKGAFLVIGEIRLEIQRQERVSPPHFRLTLRLELYIYDYLSQKKIFWGTMLAEASSKYLPLDPTLSENEKLKKLFSSELLELLRNRSVTELVRLLDNQV